MAGILREFLLKHRAEARHVSIYEYDEELHLQTIQKESYEDGLEAGRAEERENTERERRRAEEAQNRAEEAQSRASKEKARADKAEASPRMSASGK